MPTDKELTPADEYYISFTTDKNGDVPTGCIDALRVRLDMVRFTPDQMDKSFRIDLCDHPLYEDLKLYVKANP